MNFLCHCARRPALAALSSIAALKPAAKTDQLNVKLSHEHTNYMWLNFDEAIEQVTFDQEIELLNSAKEYLKSKRYI